MQSIVDVFPALLEQWWLRHKHMAAGWVDNGYFEGYCSSAAVMLLSCITQHHSRDATKESQAKFR